MSFDGERFSNTFLVAQCSLISNKATPFIVTDYSHGCLIILYLCQQMPYYWNYSHKIGDLLFPKLCWHNRPRPSYCELDKICSVACPRSYTVKIVAFKEGYGDVH